MKHKVEIQRLQNDTGSDSSNKNSSYNNNNYYNNNMKEIAIKVFVGTV